MVLVEDDHMVEAIAAYGSDEPFHERILPRGPRRSGHLLNAHAGDPSYKFIAVDAIAVADHVAGCCVLWKCLDNLLRRPRAGRV